MTAPLTTAAAIAASLVLSFAAPALAAHPVAAACGGLSAHQEDGVRDGRVLSRAGEKRIEDFLIRADATPGVSIAIVKDDKIVYLRGFGFRDLKDCKPALSDTRYYLKSTTKNFLGAAAAVLHEEGAIDLGAPISDYLPELKFPDGLNPAQTSIRAHLTHTQPYFDGGLNYRTAFPGNLPEQDFVAHVNEFSDAKDIRFRYSNFGPIMAAHAIGAKTGANWRDFIRETVFQPAGMTNSFTAMADAEQGPMAQGYLGGFDGVYEEELTKTEDQMHAAGGSVSTAADLARWLIVNLNDGEIDGAEALPKRAIQQTHARQAQLDAEFFDYRRFAYGLGLYAADYEGDLLMHHFGGETHLSFMPERGLGVIVLTNELGAGVYVTHALASTIYDMLLGKEDLDARMEARLDAIANRRTKNAGRLDAYLAMMRDKAPSGPARFPEASLAGTYSDPRLGAMEIINGRDGLKVVYGAISGALEPIGGDMYLADIGLWNSMPPQGFVFRNDETLGLVLDWDGRVFVKQN